MLKATEDHWLVRSLAAIRHVVHISWLRDSYAFKELYNYSLVEYDFRKKMSLFYNKYTFNSSNLSVSIRKNKNVKHNYEAKQYKTNIYKEKNKFSKTEKFKNSI